MRRVERQTTDVIDCTSALLLLLLLLLLLQLLLVLMLDWSLRLNNNSSRGKFVQCADTAVISNSMIAASVILFPVSGTERRPTNTAISVLHSLIDGVSLRQ